MIIMMEETAHLPSLRELAERRGLLIGYAVATDPFREHMETGETTPFITTLAREFNILTPENFTLAAEGELQDQVVGDDPQAQRLQQPAPRGEGGRRAAPGGVEPIEERRWPRRGAVAVGELQLAALEPHRCVRELHQEELSPISRRHDLASAEGPVVDQLTRL